MQRKSLGLMASLLVLTAAVAPHAFGGDISNQPTLTLDGAKRAAAAAIAYARSHGAPGGSIAIVDAGGHTLYLERLDGTFPAASDVSIGKARTAVNFGKPTRGLEEANIPVAARDHISPMYFFENITAAISIHHGLADQLVLVEWSQLTCDQLKALGNNVECHYYENMPHTFTGTGDEQFIQNTIQFFNQYLTAP